MVMQNPKSEQDTDELVDMIEQLMDSGSGHLTISGGKPEDEEGLHVQTFRSMDCSAGNMACCQPTELMDEI